MKSEKEFIKSMWTVIESEQVIRYEEKLAADINAWIFRKNIRMGIFIVALVTIPCLVGIFSGAFYSNHVVEIFAFVLIVIAFIIDMKSYREEEYDFGNIY